MININKMTEQEMNDFQGITKPKPVLKGTAYYKKCFETTQDKWLKSELRVKALERESGFLHKEIGRQSENNIQLMLDKEQLTVEASMSVANRKERNYYRRSARLWCVCSTLLLVGILSLAVWL